MAAGAGPHDQLQTAATTTGTSSGLGDDLDGGVGDLDCRLVVDGVRRPADLACPSLRVSHRVVRQETKMGEDREVDDSQRSVASVRRRPGDEVITDPRCHHHAARAQPHPDDVRQRRQHVRQSGPPHPVAQVRRIPAGRAGRPPPAPTGPIGPRRRWAAPSAPGRPATSNPGRTWAGARPLHDRCPASAPVRRPACPAVDSRPPTRSGGPSPRLGVGGEQCLAHGGHVRIARTWRHRPDRSWRAVPMAPGLVVPESFRAAG